MASSQYPLDGKIGKAWKVTSPFGWRKHPITGKKKHHNGVDIWQSKEPSYLEACFDGKVIAVKPNNDPNSAGHSIIVQSTVMGKKVTWTYFHMVKGSIKVKVGQKIEAGTVVGKMGDTGFATGKHLHWEIWAGHVKSQPNTNSGGKGFFDPMEFTKAVIAWEKVNKTAPLATPEDAPVSVAPAHSQDGAPAPATPAAPVERATIKVGSKGGDVKYLQKKLDITADGDFGPNTRKAVVAFQTKKGLTADGIVGPTTWVALG
jgi:murein DD-endopeptidase MepM/ murein hydrolase activator NlpD